VHIPDAPVLGFTPNYEALAECKVTEPAGLTAAGMKSNEGGIVKV
jgi:hypothetical protein